MRNGIFIISLDFELHWGGFEKWPLHGAMATGQGRGEPYYNPAKNYNEYFLNTRTVIPEMLRLFGLYGVHVTWATVGMLFHRDKDELKRNAPPVKPVYSEPELSAYNYIGTKGIGTNEESDPYHFAPSLIQQILATGHQEIGTHTFAHYYCNEPGQGIGEFREDLRAAQRVAQTYGVKLRSLVFPRNQFNEEYLRVCYEEGITIVRSNPLDWFWRIDSTQNESTWKRLNRGLDAYVPVGRKNTYPLSALSPARGLPLSLPASRLLRPYNPRELFLNEMKIDRIKAETQRAASRGEIYHLWWHPHNFGRYPEQSLQGLKKILEQYEKCKKVFQMKSMNMGEIAELRESLPSVIPAKAPVQY